MTVIVTGGRNYQDRNRVFEELDKLAGPFDEENMLGSVDLTIWHGACPSGADRWADEHAVVCWTGLREFPADWSRWGKAAGPIRNEEMAAVMPKADLCLAFPGGAGTADMVARGSAPRDQVREIVS